MSNSFNQVFFASREDSESQEVRQVNNQFATLTLWEDSIRKLAKLDLQADDRLQVEQALEVFRMQAVINGTEMREPVGETINVGSRAVTLGEYDHIASDVPTEEVQDE